MLRLITTFLAAVSGFSLEHLFYNFDSPGGCPTTTNNVLNIGLTIPIPSGASGIQIRQVAYVARSNSFSQPNTMTISGNGKSSSVSPVYQSQLCCSSTNCDLALVSPSWYNTNCGNPQCSVISQWYKINFITTQIGTCTGCGINGTGSISLNVDFNDMVLPVGDYGRGTTFYVSYLLISNPSVSATQSQSTSSTLSPSISMSMSYSPSESSVFFTSRYATQTATSFETPNCTLSQTPSFTSTPKFLKTAYPSIDHNTPTASKSPLFMALRYPSATNTPHVFEPTDNPTDSSMGKAAVGSAGLAVGGTLMYVVNQLLQRFRNPNLTNNNNNNNETEKAKKIKENLEKIKRRLESDDKIAHISVHVDDLHEIELMLTHHRKNYQTIQ